MRRKSYKGIRNMDHPDTKMSVRAFIGPLTGMYEFRIEPKAPNRSNRQNNWYWAGIVRPFYEYLSEQDYEITDDEQAHDILAAKCLGIDTRADPVTGEVLFEQPKSTAVLTVEQFYDYCERCRAWLTDRFNILTEDPDAYGVRGKTASAGATR
jgi:hypothetical protein